MDLMDICLDVYMDVVYLIAMTGQVCVPTLKAFNDRMGLFYSRTPPKAGNVPMTLWIKQALASYVSSGKGRSF